MSTRPSLTDPGIKMGYNGSIPHIPPRWREGWNRVPDAPHRCLQGEVAQNDRRSGLKHQKPPSRKPIKGVHQMTPGRGTQPGGTRGVAGQYTSRNTQVEEKAKPLNHSPQIRARANLGHGRRGSDKSKSLTRFNTQLTLLYLLEEYQRRRIPRITRFAVVDVLYVHHNIQSNPYPSTRRVQYPFHKYTSMPYRHLRTRLRLHRQGEGTPSHSAPDPVKIKPVLPLLTNSGNIPIDLINSPTLAIVSSELIPSSAQRLCFSKGTSRSGC